GRGGRYLAGRSAGGGGDGDDVGFDAVGTVVNGVARAVVAVAAADADEVVALGEPHGQRGGGGVVNAGHDDGARVGHDIDAGSGGVCLGGAIGAGRNVGGPGDPAVVLHKPGIGVGVGAGPAGAGGVGGSVGVDVVGGGNQAVGV